MAWATAPKTSLRPVARPGSVAVAAVVPPPPQATASSLGAIRPVERPGAKNDAAQAAASAAQPSAPSRQDAAASLSVGEREQRRGAAIATPQDASAASVTATSERRGLFSSLRPLLRPRGVTKKAVARKQQRARGAVCGDLSIQGAEIGRVPGRLNGCGVENAVRVHEISGVALSQKAVMDCVTAKSVKRWIDGGMKPAVGNYGGGVRALHVVAHYACRTRNNQRGAKISEHGRGRAIDIAGFVLRDGNEITVLSDWNSGAEGRILRRMHRAACGPFGTVLGPDANRFHRDHFHFDTARYRSGSYCR
ncbi:extensin-like protein [Roseovarius spongiae]|uniref:Extensin-like protein n=2 Tax=Roseovarius spongiae TaxID=2320272 RepID=A0A3A8ASS9_9RHOB|nr:extensin-like protein [Roseovarius spongiae]